MTDFLRQHTIQIFDSSTSSLKDDSFSHFAIGDALLRMVNQPQKPAFLHFWPIDRMAILGMMDTKLPYLTDGIAHLEEQGYEVRVRPAGGLAVIADPGILNFSLIFAENDDEKISIDEGYEIMVDLIRKTFASFGKEIEAYEIVDSYCPGKFDLSIDGKKFAGIAQRRFKQGIGVMIYLSVEGDQHHRGALLRDFYQKGLRGEKTKWDFPAVNPDSMANLSDLLEVPLTIQQVKEMLLSAMKEMNLSLVEGVYTEVLMAEYQQAHEKLQKRNQQIMEKTTRE